MGKTVGEMISKGRFVIAENEEKAKEKRKSLRGFAVISIDEAFRLVAVYRVNAETTKDPDERKRHYLLNTALTQRLVKCFQSEDYVRQFVREERVKLGKL